jgi:hypothetical protein
MHFERDHSVRDVHFDIHSDDLGHSKCHCKLSGRHHSRIQ